MNDIKFRSRAQVAAVGNTADGVVTAEGADACIQSLKAAAELKKKAVRRALVQDYWKNSPDISPIAGSLSVFGLTIDDLTFASLHRTATKLNDVNEAATLDHQMRHLGRRAGNPLLTIAQKSVIGRGLGASSAYAINGGLQAMHSGVIPGNRGHKGLLSDELRLRAEGCPGHHRESAVTLRRRQIPRLPRQAGPALQARCQGAGSRAPRTGLVQSQGGVWRTWVTSMSSCSTRPLGGNK